MIFDNIKQGYQSHSRLFKNYTFIYPVLSRRAGGISIGINLNLDKNCNFDCPYCQVVRTEKIPPKTIDLSIIEIELKDIMLLFDSEGVCQLTQFEKIPACEKKLKDISLSGDGEPTMVPEFSKVCQIVREIQKNSLLPFELHLITNSTLIHKKTVLEGIGFLMEEKGGIWAKLDAGTQSWFEKVNDSLITLEQIEKNLIACAKKFPIILQTLFFEIDKEKPQDHEILEYCKRVKRIQSKTQNLKLIQIHSLSRIPSQSSAVRLSKYLLQEYARQIQDQTQIKTQVF